MANILCVIGRCAQTKRNGINKNVRQFQVRTICISNVLELILIPDRAHVINDGISVFGEHQ